jgi:TetR/AcrR family transcriptional regulator, regulator of cefoperazone and chloramphenicol sensitivity
MYSDLTARARIRDAALRLFTERGIDGTSIRDIAAAAEVSSGLIRHHFGSKESLRDACDSYATEQLSRIRDELFADGGMADQAGMVAMHPTAMVFQRYLVRSMQDGSEAAEGLFDDAVRLGEDWVTRTEVETRDVRAYSALLVAMQMGVFMLRDQLSRAFGEDVDSPAGQLRLQRAFAEVFSTPLLTPEQSTKIQTALDRLQEGL